MRSIVHKAQEIFTQYGQVLLVLLAFALMAVSSYLIVSQIEREHLHRYANDAIL